MVSMRCWCAGGGSGHLPVRCREDLVNKFKPIRPRIVKGRIDRGAPDEPLTPGLRKKAISTDAIGFIHDFEPHEAIEDKKEP